ncbi:MCE family protein [Aeromicrobium sp. Leaf350]|uniref:MCE family protein n=1 Tax=Aeromicrobium sp. Leaf350 TaxID=2876565 RepID=UPI001E63989B|nr:MCE family protein [Aeromicrobium sp. Leaf350]
MKAASRLREPRTVGLLGVVAVVVGALVVVFLSTASLGKNHATAIIEHTAGLRVGEEVQVSGVGVGEVTAIRLTKDAVAVEFTIDADVDLGSTTSASVKVATLLGTHYLEISPSGSGTLADDTIPLDRTDVPYNLQDVIDGTQEQLSELDEDGLAEAMTVVADVLGRTPEEAQAAFAGVEALSSVAVQRTDELAALLDASAAFTGMLVDQQDEILVLLDQSALVLEALTSRQTAIDALLVDAQSLADQVTGLLADTADDLDPLMTNLTESLDHLYEVRDSITSTVTSLSTMTVYLANASGNGPWIDLHVPSAIPDNLFCLSPSRECS